MPHADTCRVIHGIRDRCGSADIAEFAEPFDTGRIDVVVALRDQDDVQLVRYPRSPERGSRPNCR